MVESDARPGGVDDLVHPLCFRQRLVASRSFRGADFPKDHRAQRIPVPYSQTQPVYKAGTYRAIC